VQDLALALVPFPRDPINPEAFPGVEGRADNTAVQRPGSPAALPPPKGTEQGRRAGWHRAACPVAFPGQWHGSTRRGCHRFSCPVTTAPPAPSRGTPLQGRLLPGLPQREGEQKSNPHALRRLSPVPPEPPGPPQSSTPEQQPWGHRCSGDIPGAAAACTRLRHSPCASPSPGGVSPHRSGNQRRLWPPAAAGSRTAGGSLSTCAGAQRAGGSVRWGPVWGRGRGPSAAPPGEGSAEGKRPRRLLGSTPRPGSSSHRLPSAEATSAVRLQRGKNPSVTSPRLQTRSPGKGDPEPGAEGQEWPRLPRRRRVSPTRRQERGDGSRGHTPLASPPRALRRVPAAPAQPSPRRTSGQGDAERAMGLCAVERNIPQQQQQRPALCAANTRTRAHRCWVLLSLALMPWRSP